MSTFEEYKRFFTTFIGEPVYEDNEIIRYDL